MSGEALRSSNTFTADLIKTAPINFDSFELNYIKDYQLFIRLGIEDNPGSKNELTLEAGKLPLGEGMTYSIGPKPMPVQASLGLEGHLEYLPETYWGSLEIKRIVTKETGRTTVNASFSIGWQNDDGNDMEVKCSTLEVST